jgi:SagB-type dehydrogenase family enzyme
MEIKSGRNFLRFFDQEEYEKNVPESDQAKKILSPPMELPYPSNAELIDLVPVEELKTTQITFLSIVNSRVSRRKYLDEPLSIEELSYLLWCTQGVKRQIKLGAFRTVPSAGARGPLETYLYIRRVDGLSPGIYRYISLQHKLLFIKRVENAEETFTHLAYEQEFVAKGAVLFIWVAVPYRTEWRYTTLSHKFIAIDLGIVCENLYLACESRKLGTVAIGYYEQGKLDKLLGLDSDNVFSVLIAPVGKFAEQSDIRKFFETQKSNVSLETMKHYIGTYHIPNGPQVEVILEMEQLVISSDIFTEPLTPHSNTEFIGGEVIRAVRFISDKNGVVQKMVVLPGIISDKDLIEIIKK